MKTRYFALVVFAAAVLLSPIRNVEACGPDFEPEIFVNTTSPDDIATFAKGQLGILQAGYDSNEYAVAWRYLNAGKLSASELSAYAPPPLPPQQQPDWSKMSPDQIAAAARAQQLAEQNARPYGRWMLARDQYAPSPLPPSSPQSAPPENSGNLVMDENYLNCPDPAFTAAAVTVNNRAGVWGAHSPWLADWIHAQDTVFSNCDGKKITIPSPVAANNPALLKADRAYQIASAMFYAKQFDDAARQFAAIAADHTSPWSSWGDYLAARATIRKAFAMGKATDPYGGELATYDSATMLRAQQMLEAILAQPNPTPSRAIVQAELNLILIRTDPEKRAAEISAALTGPQPDPNFAQDLKDLSWLLQNHIAIQNPPPLLAWIAAWRSGDSASAFATWQQSHAVPWFAVAIAKASPSEPFVPQLLDEALKIAPGSPAYDTVFYHRVRLLIALNRPDEARALLDKSLAAPSMQKPGSERNALLGQRMAVARDFNEFLQFAPRKVLFSGSEGDSDLLDECIGSGHPSNSEMVQCRELEKGFWFDQDAAQIVDQQISLPLLIQAANAQSLPLNLRHSIAIVAWTRSVLLQDGKRAAAISPLLPKTLHDAVGSSIGFPADLAILRNPGIRPYLEAGVPRVASYSYFDSFRNNGWSKPWQIEPDSYPVQANPAPLPVPSFISSAQLAQAAEEYQLLQQLPDGAVVIGQRVIDYAGQHPADPLVPEALALTVRATHYDCQTFDPKVPYDQRPKFSTTGKAAFELLHQHYPKSPWTAKTPYYY